LPSAEALADASPIAFTASGVRQLVTMTNESIVGIDARSGRSLCSRPPTTAACGRGSRSAPQIFVTRDRNLREELTSV
jgi:hypothetical protein